jgi:hypothetical protein
VLLSVVLGCWSFPPATPPGARLDTWPSTTPLTWTDGTGKTAVIPQEQRYGRSVGTPVSHVNKFSPPSGGAAIEIRWTTGEVVFPNGNERRSMVTGEIVVADNSAGWNIHGSFDDALNYSGDPPDVLAADANVTFSRGHRHCSGTSFDTEEIRVRLHGDGNADLAPIAPSSGPSAAPVSSVKPP